MPANNYIGYLLLLKSAKKQFFVSIYLFFKFIIFKKLYRKKIKDNRALQLSHEENIRNHLRINEDWFSHNINTLDFFFNRFFNQPPKARLNSARLTSESVL